MDTNKHRLCCHPRPFAVIPADIAPEAIDLFKRGFKILVQSKANTRLTDTARLPEICP